MTTLPSATPAKIFMFTVLEEEKAHMVVNNCAKFKAILISSIKVKAILVMVFIT